jgi:hypothetical protein
MTAENTQVGEDVGELLSTQAWWTQLRRFKAAQHGGQEQ